MKLSPAAAIIALSAQSPSLPAVVMAGSGKTGKIVPSSSNGKLSKVFKSKSKALIKTSAANSYSYSSSMSIDIDTDPPTSRPTVAPTIALDRCGLTPQERAGQIKELMSTVSDPITFDDPNSPQAKALDWITNKDAISPILCPNRIEEGVGCTRGGVVNDMIQRYVLAVFYYATDGDDWDQCSAASDFSDSAAVAEADANCDRVVTPFGVANARVGDTSTNAWLGAVNECEWGGVACWGADTPNLNLCTDQLDFENDGLAGTLPTEIGTLHALRFFILEDGETGGTIPKIGGTIPTEYGKLERLLILDMDSNELSGSLPAELYGIPKLQQLDLNNNQIAGTIPSFIGDLSSLTQLGLDNNRLTGTIPDSFSGLPNLQVIDLNNNQIAGTIPPDIGDLSSLTLLRLDNNEITGTVPDSIYGLSSLQVLDLNGNDLTGTISPAIGDLSSLALLGLANNELVGTIPTEMGQLKNLRIAYLSEDEFTGVMPEEVCALRNDTEPPGNLELLVTDCAGESENPEPEVICTCCSSCTGGPELPIDLTEKLPINFTVAMRASNDTP